ncbi:DUF1014-domain-containing protein [Eremomyces bilateralis CBS 781.70]|uniref:DUF1014-domain-containing protein n=1 Tax=Eremomyces bilateralis CBS 781.70 TaxID=1392243 RepID=A0A6G1G2M2_9PEZI|nr:DUF1014-domain-containing protein [Eremomyces bilateralis CBS 781.70]KAF1812355.1 DUF1014-domain-containing protein [Eremomyces bilateralis CBS 781.70]
MGGKKGGENSRKVAGNARKADAAAAKQAAVDAAASAAEGKQWQKGAKDTSKSEAAAAKAEEAARKKAEKAALLAAEDAELPSKKAGGSKGAQKKKVGRPAGSGLDTALSSLDKPASSISATGIDNALDALSLTSGHDDKLDRHPERRFKAAYNAFEERRLGEMVDDKSLRRQQKITLIRKEFEKSEENPFNRVTATYDMSKEELKGLKEAERQKVESRLTEGSGN